MGEVWSLSGHEREERPKEKALRRAARLMKTKRFDHYFQKRRCDICVHSQKVEINPALMS